MTPSIEAIRQYQQIYKELFGEDLSTEEAETSGSKLIQLIKTVLQDSARKEKGDSL